MIRDITIGQYYPSESALHRLDPRVKIIGTLVYVISLFLFRNPAGLLVATLFLGFCIGLSKVPLSFIFKGVRAILVFLLITVVFNLFLVPGEPVLRIWKLTISREGIHTAVFTAIRLIYLIFGSSLMTLTTTPNHLTDGLERLLEPLRIIHVPAHEVAMMMSIALRFIPILLEETDKIMKAQTARGADFERGGLIRKVKGLVPLLVPLFISAFRRASDLALAMEARCYRGGKGRTKMNPLRYTAGDRIAYGVILLYLILLTVALRFT